MCHQYSEIVVVNPHAPESARPTVAWGDRLCAKCAAVTELMMVGQDLPDELAPEFVRIVMFRQAGCPMASCGATRGYHPGLSCSRHCVCRRRVSRKASLALHCEPPSPAPPEDAMTRLKRLKELLDVGAITQAEYDEKKAPLMAQI